MKAIINGLRYDTDTATQIGEVTHGNPGDWGFVTEALYQTPRSKRFFLAGQGGPRSQYAVSVRPGEWSGGKKITPLDRDDAQAWAESNLPADTVEAIFGDSIEDA